MIGVGTWRTQAEFREIEVTRGDTTLYASDASPGLEGWMPVRGRWQFEDGTLRQTSNQEDAVALFGDPDWSDYTLTLKARKLGGNEGFLILVGVPDEETRNWWNIGGWGNTEHGIQIPGTPEERVAGRVETGRWYDIKVELSGDTIRTYLDGQLIQSSAQTPQTKTIRFNTEAPGERMPLRHWGWISPCPIRTT
jgi:hypothetical protein